MKRLTCCLAWMFLLIGAVAAQDKEVKLKIVQTSDIHGNFYPHDFILQREAAGSLARVHAFVQKARETYKDNLILLDNGDILLCTPIRPPIAVATVIITLIMKLHTERGEDELLIKKRF